jgi:hypothetical protein
MFISSHSLPEAVNAADSSSNVMSLDSDPLPSDMSNHISTPSRMALFLQKVVDNLIECTIGDLGVLSVDAKKFDFPSKCILTDLKFRCQPRDIDISAWVHCISKKGWIDAFPRSTSASCTFKSDNFRNL